jgi:sigma-B regulation protein RsbU (phosphoserine phosphatase)
MASAFDDEKIRLKQALDELIALNKISSAVNSLMAVKDITRVIIDNCLTRTQTSQGVVFLIEEEDKSVDKAKTFVREFSRDASQIPFHLSQSLTAWMTENRTLFMSNNPETDSRLKGLHLADIGISSLLSAPLLSHTGLIGWLVLFNKKDAGGFTEGDKRFVGIVVSQTAKVIENARLREQEEQFNIVKEEMKVARQIQEGFLPKKGLALPDCQICGHNLPARDVGGDFFDIVELDGKRVFISLGDVSGKGMPAALLMANAQAVLRSHLFRKGELKLKEMAGSLNDLIFQFSGPDRFITTILGHYEYRSRVFRYVNAGHPPPILFRSDGTIVEPSQADIVIGVIAGYAFTEAQIRLKAGDILVIYSDGITELFNENDEEFGEERLRNLIMEVRYEAVEDICGRIFNALKNFRGNRQQSDDITFVVMKACD